MSKRVLVAVDGSSQSLKALKFAMDTAPSAELHLINVRSAITGSAASYLGRKTLDEYHLEEGMKDLGPALEAARAPGTQPKHHVTVGSPGETIARFADQIAADFIVIGSKGRGQLSDMVLGSAVQSVLQESRVPVLVIK
jgi:nucleotide-binding universal stress UspA family protein